ncbi:MAG: nucleotidyltransferase family protein [Clostridia bacterium]
MLLGFIICEYNPFHNGHLMQLQYTKNTLGCDKIICVMSGNIVQRGEVAVADKYTRASWAIKAGADLVVEIPPKFCLGSAESFAQGAISLIATFAGEKLLCFGAECGDIKKLNTIADIINQEFTQNKIKAFIKEGNNYPQSVSLALAQYCIAFDLDPTLPQLLSNPNNTLAIEYLLAIDRNKIDIAPRALKRTNDYNGLGVQCNISSASAIRNCLEQNKKIATKHTVPTYVFEQLPQEITSAKLFSIAKYCLFDKDMSQVFGAKEGLDNRIKKTLAQSENMQAFFNLVNTKRYPLATIKRILLAAIVDCHEQPQSIKFDAPDYLNVLAIKKSSLNLLGQSTLNCITKPSDYERFDLNDPLMRKVDKLFEATQYNFERNMKIFD